MSAPMPPDTRADAAFGKPGHRSMATIPKFSLYLAEVIEHLDRQEFNTHNYGKGSNMTEREIEAALAELGNSNPKLARALKEFCDQLKQQAIDWWKVQKNVIRTVPKGETEYQFLETFDRTRQDAPRNYYMATVNQARLGDPVHLGQNREQAERLFNEMTNA